MNRIASKHAWLLSVVVVLWWPNFPATLRAGEPSSHGVSTIPEWVGIAAPGKESKLAGAQSGQIGKVLVQEGETVTAGDLLCELTDGAQKARVRFAQADADTSFLVELAKAKADQAQRDLTRLTGLHGDDFASSKELSDAFASAEISRLDYEQARHNHQQAERTYQREEAVLRQFYIRAPFSGYVSRLHKQAGEGIESGDAVLTLSQLHPLEVSLDCTLSFAPYVRVGQLAVVRPIDPHWMTRRGTVSLVSRTADPASQTFRVKLTVPNADGAWMSGIKVAVRFERLELHDVNAGSQPSAGGSHAQEPNKSVEWARRPN